MERTDEELVIAHRQGDQASLDELIGRYLKPIFIFLRHLTNDSPETDDIVQNTFVKVWQNLWRFNVNRRFRPWLFRIAKNTAIDYLRKRRPVPFSAFEDESGYNPVIDNLADDSPLPDELLQKSETGQVLAGILRDIPAIYREVLVLRHHNQFSFEEVSEILGSPINTVKSRHRRGLMMLKRMIQDRPEPI